MFGANFEVDSFEAASAKSCFLELIHRASYSLLSQASVVFNASLHFVESRWRCHKVDVSCVVFLTGGYISQLVLDHGEHFSNSVKDAASELVLVVDREPAAKHSCDGRLENL